MAECPCGSGRDHDECCGPLLREERQARTAEEQMRARYTAYATQQIDFIEKTTHPNRRRELDKQSARAWSERSTWQGLEIVSIEAGGEDDDRGSVEFIARYTRDGEETEHHEVADFRKRDGRWYFVDGRRGGAETFRREAPKVGRNDPCPCGSGKKYKKCCGKG